MMPSFRWQVIAALLALGLGGCATLGGPPRPGESAIETGTASFYASRFHGRRTASGVRYDAGEMMAAHRTLPFGTRVRVTHLRNHRSVVVTVVDRGPFRKGRIIDLSRKAASELGFVREGTARVSVQVLPDQGPD